MDNYLTTMKASVYSIALGAAFAAGPVNASDYVGTVCQRVEFVTATVEAPYNSDESDYVVYIPENETLYKLNAFDRKSGIYHLQGP